MRLIAMCHEREYLFDRHDGRGFHTSNGSPGTRPIDSNKSWKRKVHLQSQRPGSSSELCDVRTRPPSHSHISLPNRREVRGESPLKGTPLFRDVPSLRGVANGG